MSVKKTNVIEWINAGPEDVLWAYPYEDIRWGSVVVVHEYENAIFMRDGKVYDILPPGRHVITTQNIPLLTRAFRLITGYGETPFKANIIFVSLKQHKGKFGTSTRVKLSPRTLYMTEMQTFGEFWFRVSDPILLLTQAVGAVPSFSASDLTNFLRSFFTELFIQEVAKYTAIEVYTHLEDVTSRIKTGTVYEAFKQRGLELLDLKIGGVSLPVLEKNGERRPYIRSSFATSDPKRR
jgi:membrane protease subunit (stomatin/prohibitin family)